MKLSHLSGSAAIALAAMSGAASADTIFGPTFEASCNCTITVQVPASPQTEPSPLPFSLVNLGTGATGQTATINPPNVGINSISFAGGNPTVSGLYSGSPSGATSPFGSGNTTDNYLVAGVGGTVTVNYTNPQTTLDLLWGTVDTSGPPNAQNQAMTFNAGSNTITGADIAAVVGSTLTNGVFDVAVHITGLSSFQQLVASDNSLTNPAFEWVPGVAPAPVVGHGLLVLLAVGGVLFGGKFFESLRTRLSQAA